MMEISLYNNNGNCIDLLIKNAKAEYQKLCLIQVELFYPDNESIEFSPCFDTFSDYFNKGIQQLKSHNVSSPHIAYIAHKGITLLTIIINREDFPDITNHSSHITGVANLIESAWAKALGCNEKQLFEKIRFPINAVTHING